MAQKNNLLTFPAKRNFNCFQLKTFLIYSLLFCLLVPLCFFQFFVYGKSFCSGDGITEHTAFLAFYGEWLRTIAYNFIHGKFIVPTFSFSLGFGADIISSLTWFCIGDPLNLLSIFVPKNGTYILFVFLAVLRFYLSGISFIFYCNTHKFQKNIIPFGAISYSFCGYALFVGIRHPYFLNPLIFLPLLCIGIDKILDRKSPVFFIIFSFLACVCNYYFFYMLSFFVFVYAAVRFFFVVKIERKFLCKEFFKTFFRTFGFYMIAVMMAAFILFPSAYGFLTASRTTEKIEVNFFYSLAYYANLFSSVSSPASVGGFFGSIGFAPVVFVTLLFLFTLNDKISKQLKIFISLGILFFIWPFFGHFINGFNYITNRWCFAFAFLVCVSFVYAFPLFCKSSFKELKIPLLIAVVQNLLVIFSCIISQARRQHYALCYIYSLAVFLILYFLIKKRKDIRIFSLVSIFIGIVVIAFVRYSPYGLSYLDDFREFGIYEGNVAKNTDIEILKLNDADFFRYDEENKFTANNAVVFGTKSTSYNYSISDIHLMQFYEDIALAKTSLMSCSSLNRRSALQNLFAVKYFVLPAEADYAPEYMTFVKEFDTYGGKKKLYKLNNPSPFAVPYKNVLYADKNFEKLNPIEKQELFLDTAVIYDEKSEDNTDEPELKLNSKILRKNVSFVGNDDVKIEENKITTKRKNAAFEIDFSCDEDSDSKKELYLLFKNFYYTTDSYEQFKPQIRFVSSSGKEESFSFGMTNANDSMGHNRMPCFGLQECKSGKFFVTLENKGVYEFDEISVFALDISERDEKFNSRDTDEISSLAFSENKISLETSLNEKQFVRFSMPYSKGWKIFIDGKETKSYRCDIAFIGTFVDAGNHSVVLKYSTPFLAAGVVSSFIGLIALVALCFYLKSRKKENE